MGRLYDRLGVTGRDHVGHPGARRYKAMSLRRWFRARLPRSPLMHLFIGVGASFGPMMADMLQWFLRHRGIAVGMAASGNYIGGALWPTPVLQYKRSRPRGWRHTYLGVGVLCVLATRPFIFALRRRSTGGASDQRGCQRRRPPAPRAQSWRFAQRADVFLLCVAGLACCVTMAMPQVHIVAYCSDLGYKPGARRRDAFHQRDRLGRGQSKQPRRSSRSEKSTCSTSAYGSSATKS